MKLLTIAALVLATFATLTAPSFFSERGQVVKDGDAQHPFARRFALPADAFDGGSGWLNSGGPLPLPKLRGKIVLLDFWTFCCINCIHVLADLEKLEQEFHDELLVIGVHSPKFPGEQDSGNVQDAVMRYDMKHPVVNDVKHTIWNRFGANSWPTLVLIDAEGAAVRMYSGEGNYDDIRADIKRLIAYHESKKNLDRTPIAVATAELTTQQTPLRFPGKVVADLKRNRLYIADSSHHRIVVVEAETWKLIETIGAAIAGLADGDYSTAKFNDPQGMALDGDILWLADRKNHALRAIDLSKRVVKTVAGNGVRGFERSPEAVGIKASLASPWDLLIVDRVLYIAMAGTHQIWTMKLETPGVMQAFAGSGRENIRDGLRAEANFAQPSGLASDGEWLYVADSETSAVRAVGLQKDVVKTLIGAGLFEFGDIDGRGQSARLQHALGVAYNNGVLFVADTYNNRLKKLSPDGALTSWLGDGKSGRTDQPPRFDEPGGVHWAGGKLYVADTNNHAIRVVDLASNRVTTLEITGLTPPAEPSGFQLPANAVTTSVPDVLEVATSGASFSTELGIPAGSKLNEEAPAGFRIWDASDPRSPKLVEKGRLAIQQKNKATVALPAGMLASLATSKKVGVYRLVLNYFTCETGSEGVCRSITRVWEFRLKVGPTGKQSITLKY